MRLLLILSFVSFIYSFQIKPINKKETKLYGITKFHIKLGINLLNIIDTHPGSISVSKFIQYKIILKDMFQQLAEKFKDEMYENNLNFSLDIFFFSMCCVCLYYNIYLFNKEAKKIDIFVKEEETEICLRDFNIFISFISYFLFKDVLSAS